MDAIDVVLKTQATINYIGYFAFRSQQLHCQLGEVAVITTRETVIVLLES